MTLSEKKQLQITAAKVRMGIIESTAKMPVCKGWSTLFRGRMPGAIFSTG